jgi:glycosyltransferase involved in cell wall biosynthesis
MCRKLRILQMCAVDFTVRQFLLPLVDALSAEGHEVDIACAPGPYFPELQKRGYRMIANPVDRSLHVGRHAMEVWRTWRLLRRNRYDVVHVHTPIASLVGRLAARLAGVPAILYTAHGFYFHDDMSALKRRLFITLEQFGSWCGHRILCVSDEDRQAALRLGIARPGSIETIYNGIDTEHFSPRRFGAEDRRQIRERLGIPLDALVVGTVGRMVREKGLLELVAAAGQLADKHPRLHLLIVGDELPSDHDGVKARLREALASAGLDQRVTLPGLVPDPAPMLAAMDLFTLPSYREGMPISLLEAMAMELPCVTTDVRGCREEVVHGESGWIVAPRDAARLAEALDEALSDPVEAARRGKAARRRVLEHFDIRRIVARQLAIYRELVPR